MCRAWVGRAEGIGQPVGELGRVIPVGVLVASCARCGPLGLVCLWLVHSKLFGPS